MTVFDLIPNYNQKSFYGKAKVIFFENGNKLLRSYDTIICMIDAQGGFHRLWKGYSATTQRHINAFLFHFQGKVMSKAYWNGLQVENQNDVDRLTNDESFAAMMNRRTKQ